MYLYIYVYTCIHICLHMFPNSWNLLISLQSSCTGSLQIVLCWRPHAFQMWSAELANRTLLKAHALQPCALKKRMPNKESLCAKNWTPVCGSNSHADAASYFAFKRANSESYWAIGVWVKTAFSGSCLLNNSISLRYSESFCSSLASWCSVATWALLNWFT